MSTAVKTKEQAAKVPLMFLTNERTPYKANMLLMLYKAAETAQLGYMDGLHPETGEIHPLLVGIEPTENGQFRVHALARIFNNLDEIPQYLMPDGNGNYLDYRPKSEQTPAPAGFVEERQEDRPSKKGRPRKKRNGGALGRSDGKDVQRGDGRHGDLPGAENHPEAIPEEGI